jgi:hypothetical protein
MILALISLLTAHVGLAAAAAPVATDAAREPYRIPRVDDSVELDGVLDEIAWQQALTLELAYEVDPGENTPAPVRTQVYLAYSESRLLVAFRAWDPDPDAIIAHLSDRDSIWHDDYVAIGFDTYNDERRSYRFYCNPLGIQGDRVSSTDGGGGNWDAIWDSAARITADGYVVEMLIPFSSLSFQRSDGDQIWGLDATRSYPRELHHSIGLFPVDRDNDCYLCQAEKVIGFSGASPGRNLKVVPTLSSLVSQVRDGNDGPFVESASSSELGVTAHWGITSNMTLSTALNPDFSQVEADALRLDINTQFAFFYPEKRPFFLEDADFFSTPFRAVHTRTIADPRWGVKLTGKEGANTFGLFVAQDETTNLLFPGIEGSSSTTLDGASTGAVFRYRRDLGRSSAIGLLLTDREGDQYHNRLAGIDLDLRITARDRISLQVLGSQTRYPAAIAGDYEQPQGELTGTAIAFNYNHQASNMSWFADYTRISPELRADLGFIRQVGYDYRAAGYEYLWRAEDDESWYSLISAGTMYRREVDHRGALLMETTTLHAHYFGRYRSFVHAFLLDGDRGYDGQVFRNRIAVLSGGLWPTESLYLGLLVRSGDQIDYSNVQPGTLRTWRPAIRYRAGQHLSFSLSNTFQDMEVNGGRLYQARIGELRATYQINRRAFLRAVVQHADYRFTPELYSTEVDPRYRRIFNQLLFSYKINPQTVLFLGYSDNHIGDHQLPLTQTDRTAFLKLGYAWVL